jgi:hypothetical protein
MPDLITTDEARAHLRLDADTSGGADDAWLAIFIPAVSSAVLLWLKDEWRAYVPQLDSAGDVLLDTYGDPIASEVVQPVVRCAVVVELATHYRFREGEGKDNVVTPDAGHGYVLNKASTALLAPLRKSTVK